MLEPGSAFGLGLPLLPHPLASLFSIRPSSTPNSDLQDKMNSSASSTDSNSGNFDFPMYESNGETPTAKVIEYRLQKLACFEIKGIDMICLPQAYELFLKNLVGGLHTVYTKLKRLEISPLVCNVEQVRALRSLGAIQPGVNRCKLISSNDFDKLYDDCTSRPGRPAKRLAAMEEWTSKQVRQEGPLEVVNPQTNQGMILGQFLPSFSHHLLVQQMLAAATAQHQHCSEPQMIRAEEVDVESGSPEEQPPPDSAPLNLSKSEQQINSDTTSDNDSLENMRKDEEGPMSERGGSSGSAGSGGSSAVSSTNSTNQSVSVEDGTFVMGKIIRLVDMANEHFKTQREMLAKEREDLEHMKCRLREAESSGDGLRTKLEAARRRARVYFNRFCVAKNEALSLREQLLATGRASADGGAVSHQSSTDSSLPN